MEDAAEKNKQELQGAKAALNQVNTRSSSAQEKVDDGRMDKSGGIR